MNRELSANIDRLLSVFPTIVGVDLGEPLGEPLDEVFPTIVGVNLDT